MNDDVIDAVIFTMLLIINLWYSMTITYIYFNC
jgi:hypothetical protein